MSLSAAQWSQVEALFAEAVDLPRASRGPTLERVALDRAVFTELLALLAAADSGGDFLSQPVMVVSSAIESLGTGTRLGPWRVLRLVGRGGMGEVYEAERADGQFEQRAAIKLLWQDSIPLLERFQVERQILARLEHPGIARLLDGGVTAAGQPYAVMEYVEGKTVIDWCRARASPLEERLRLFLQVCEAVAHAHENLIVHRDLKPANILVDASGRVRLLDFGIAKLLDPLEAEARSPEPSPAGGGGVAVPAPARSAATPPTLSSFTPEYAAPEQLASEAITAATDVHALGMLLFELLTDQRAKAKSAGRDSSTVPAVPLASRAAADHAAAPIAPRLLRGDLDAIISKCLRIEPRKRYQSVEALRLDLERSKRGDTISARGAGRLYSYGRFAHRHRAALSTGTVALLLLGLVFRGNLLRSHDASNPLYRTSNPEVYSQYQLGHRFLARESRDGMRLAVDAFEKALQLDPEYAPALAGLALALTVRGRLHWTEAGWGDDGRRALALAEKAVAIAPGLAEAHAARGKTRSWIAWDWTPALADSDLAMRLEPGNALVLQEYSALLGSLGRLPEAILAARRATELDRLRGHAWVLLAFWYCSDGHFDLARTALDRALELNPDSEIVPVARFQVSLQEGTPERALDEAANARRPCLWCVAMAQHSLGRPVESQQALDALLKSSAAVTPYRIASVYAWRGERDRAFEWLDRAVAQHHPDLVFVKNDPILRGLRGDPRFKALLEKMKLQVD